MEGFDWSCEQASETHCSENDWFEGWNEEVQEAEKRWMQWKKQYLKTKRGGN